MTITSDMSTPEEPGDKPAESQISKDSPETVSLVDLFDQLDRAAFERSLNQRDSVYPFYTNREL